MKARLQALAERFEALSLRERGLVALAVLALLYLLWDGLLMSPEYQRQKQLVGEMHALNQQMASVEAELQSLTTTLQADAAAPQRRQMESLRQSLARLAERQQALTVAFIQPQQMAGVLRDVLATDKGLRLLALESLGASPLFPPPKDAAPEAAPPAIYRHGMRITFEGDYFASLRYLQALEAMPWRFYWEGLDYQVEDYPKARVSVTIHTLSLKEEWIGV